MDVAERAADIRVPHQLLDGLDIDPFGERGTEGVTQAMCAHQLADLVGKTLEKAGHLILVHLRTTVPGVDAGDVEQQVIGANLDAFGAVAAVRHGPAG